MNFRCRKVSKIFSFCRARFRSVETRRPRCNHIRSIYDCGRGEGVWSNRARRGLPLWRPFIAAHLCRRDGKTQARSLTLVNSLRLRPAAPKSCTTLKSRRPPGWGHWVWSKIKRSTGNPARCKVTTDSGGCLSKKSATRVLFCTRLPLNQLRSKKNAFAFRVRRCESFRSPRIREALTSV